ncbi:MAG TPA: class I SAM-dependent methyltransferase [Micromonosporaceae bacterium]
MPTSDLNSQTAYWDTVSTTKTFTHPLHLPWLESIDRQATILDYGCGYGRTMQALEQHGFDNLSGVDTSPGMIARARTLRSAMRFDVVAEPPTLTIPDAGVDAVVLFAVLTCIPSDDAQASLVAELRRVLRPGGILYLSDLLLGDDERNRDRYARFADRYGTYGVFETDDGAVCRHHSIDHLTSLLADFTVTDTRRITVATMNGHESAGIQMLARRA